MDESRRCKAKTKRGGCKKAAIRGGAVCQTHGGGAPQVKAKAAERLADLIDPDRVLREAAKLAYADPTQLYDQRGRLKPISDWPAELRAAVGSVEVVRGNIDKGDGQFDEVLRVKLWDKPKALDMLMRHLALYKDKLEVNVKGDAEILARLTAGRERVARARRSA